MNIAKLPARVYASLEKPFRTLGGLFWGSPGIERGNKVDPICLSIRPWLEIIHVWSWINLRECQYMLMIAAHVFLACAEGLCGGAPGKLKAEQKHTRCMASTCPAWIWCPQVHPRIPSQECYEWDSGEGFPRQPGFVNGKTSMSKAAVKPKTSSMAAQEADPHPQRWLDH